MNLDAVVKEAIKHNESVPTADENLNEAEENVKQGFGSISPTINANQQFFWQQNPPVPTRGFSPGYQPQTYISASQPLLQGFREWEGLKKVKRLRDAARHNKENAELAIYRQVVAGYYSILSLERDIVNVREKSKYLKDRIKDLNHFVQIGRSQLTDVLTAKSTAAANDVIEEQDRINLAQARDQFALLTGLSAGTKLDDDTEGFAPSFGTLESYLARIKQRPEVKAAKESADANNSAINVAKADHLPSIALTGDYYFDRPAIFNGVDWDAKVVITMPIFAGGVTQSKVRQAYSEAHKTDLALSLAERTADQDIRNFYDAVASDLRQNHLTEESMRISEMTFKEEQRSYKFGLVTNLDVLSALASYIDAKRTYDSNRFNLKRDFLTLKAAAIMQ